MTPYQKDKNFFIMFLLLIGLYFSFMVFVLNNQVVALDNRIYQMEQQIETIYDSQHAFYDEIRDEIRARIEGPR